MLTEMWKIYRNNTHRCKKIPSNMSVTKSKAITQKHPQLFLHA